MPKVTLIQVTNWLYNQTFSPVVIVATYDHNHHRPTGMTAGWSMPSSGRPLVYAVALWRRGYTHQLVRSNHTFSVNVPGLALADALEYFGTHHGDTVDKFATTATPFKLMGSDKTPIIPIAVASYVCRVIQEVTVGDHFVFFGQVTQAYIDPTQKTLINLGTDSTGKHLYSEAR